MTVFCTRTDGDVAAIQLVHVAATFPGIHIDVNRLPCHSFKHLGVGDVPRSGRHTVRDSYDDLIGLGQAHAGEGGFLVALCSQRLRS